MESPFDSGGIESVFVFDFGLIIILILIMKYRKKIGNKIEICYCYLIEFLKRRSVFDLRVFNNLAILGAIWWIVIYGRSIPTS